MDSDDDPPDNDDGTVLSPEELDITDDERVVEIDEGRYVISSGSGTPNITEESTPEPDVTEDSSPPATHEESDSLSEATIHEWLEEHVATADSKYGFDVTAKFEEGVAQQVLYSNDVATTFENLLVWYAQHVGSGTPVEKVLGILLMESNVPVKYPRETVTRVLAENDLDPDDTIEEFLDELDRNGSIFFPP